MKMQKMSVNKIEEKQKIKQIDEKPINEKPIDEKPINEKTKITKKQKIKQEQAKTKKFEENVKEENVKRKNQKILIGGILLLLLFVLWTVAISLIDIQEIGPKGSAVGSAAFNGFVHNLTGVHMALYTVTDWLGLVPLCFILGFAFMGLWQLIKRKSLFKVDSSILVLGGFYIIVMAAYLFFEYYVVNYRPVLINGYLEASYPSSTTMLVMCVMPTAVMQLKGRIENEKFRKVVTYILVLFTAFMVIGRLVSGVHWITDIIGGAIFSIALVMIYYSVVNLTLSSNKENTRNL